MPAVAFIDANAPASLAGLARTLRDELEAQGVSCVSWGGDWPRPRPDLVYVLLDAGTSNPGRAPAGIAVESLLPRTIVLGIGDADEAPERRLEFVGKAGALFATDERAVMTLRRLGVDARWLRLGYSSLRDRFDPELPRTIDVLFLGRPERRHALCLDRIESLLTRDARRLRIETTAVGEERLSLLTQARILLNLHAGDAVTFDALHAFDAIHAGAVIVSEHSSGLGVLEPGRHLLVGAIESLDWLVGGLLADEALLAAIRRRAYDRLRTWLPFAQSAAQVRAAIVELVGVPVTGLSP